MSPEIKKTPVTTQSENLLEMKQDIFDTTDHSQYPPQRVMTVEEKMWDILDRFPLEDWPMDRVGYSKKNDKKNFLMK